MEGKEPLQLPSGIRLYDIYIKYEDAFAKHPKGYFPVGATVNNQLVALSDKVSVNCTIDLIYPDSTTGADIYRRSLIFLLGMAWNNIFPKIRCDISHSIGHAYYFFVYPPEADVKQEQEIIEPKMKVTGEML